MKLKFILLKAVLMTVMAGLLVTTGGCTSAPKKEILHAEETVAAARGVKAEKYASEELRAAEIKLNSAKDLLNKDEDEEARKAAVEARSNARTAYEKSISAYITEETVDLKTEERAAEKAHADVAAPDKFKKAEDKQKEVLQKIEKLKKEREKLRRLEEQQKKEVAES